MHISAIDEYEMPPLTVDTVDEEGLDRLRMAIVKAAADDYVDDIKAAELTKAAGVLHNTALARMEIETFIRGKWFRLLTNDQIDGEWLIESLKKKAMEELKDEKDTDY